MVASASIVDAGRAAHFTRANQEDFVAQSAGELARVVLNDLLSQPSDEFQKAAAHVLSKNKDLYERLS